MNNDELKQLLGYGVTIADFIDHIIHGFSLAEIGEGLSLVSGASGVIANAKTALDEYMALDDAGRNDMNAWIAANVPNFPDQNIQDAVVKTLQLLISATAVIHLLEGRKQKEN